MLGHGQRELSYLTHCSEGRCPVSYTNRNVTDARDKLKQVRVLTLGICLYGETHHGGYPPGPGHIVP